MSGLPTSTWSECGLRPQNVNPERPGDEACADSAVARGDALAGLARFKENPACHLAADLRRLARVYPRKCFLDMLGVFAEFETNLRRERQLEGIAKAKAEGKYKGRPPSIDAAKVRTMKAEGQGASEIAKALKIGRASVYRLMVEQPRHIGRHDSRKAAGAVGSG
jgi:hypothetical protein